MKNPIKIILVVFACTIFLTSSAAIAQEGSGKQAVDRMALTITPPIIKNNVNPGQIWKSYIKVVNNNDQDIDAYIQLVNFESDGETGTVKLNPIDEANNNENELLINNWVIIEKGPINVPANKSTEIPFIVDVPELVNPGDHHIAILVGTRPNNSGTEGSSIKVSSMLGSLLLLNVNGDVEESGAIREFSTDKDFYNQGDVHFILRFQNTGNTILQPQGEIKIFNFQDDEKGSVKINQKTNTGNVFPEDLRRWEYSWPVPRGLFEMGRYRAEMDLSYGSAGKENVKQTIYFWVVQWKPLLITLGSFLFFILIVILMVRRYIRNAIEITQEQLGIRNDEMPSQGNISRSSDGVHAVVNLKKNINTANPPLKKKKAKKKKNSKLFITSLIIISALIISLAVFLFIYFSAKEETVMPIRDLSEQVIDITTNAK